MRSTRTDIGGVFILSADVHRDDRGAFARAYCRDTFRDLGIDAEPHQISLSFNVERGTLRGLHAQHAPHEEAKLITCAAGSIFDVAVDLREGSPSYGRWTAVTLNAGDGRSFYIPKGCAHGFQTLEANTTVAYQITTAYAVQASFGVRWNDPKLAIPWPLAPGKISVADQRLPYFRPRAAKL
jgi:dTDP-4-dehydrorhamnose 3,5-epimerase